MREVKIKSPSPVRELHKVINIREKQVHIPIPTSKKLSTKSVLDTGRETSTINCDSRKTFCERF